MTKLISEKYMEKAQTESHLSITSNDINIELNKEFLEELANLLSQKITLRVGDERIIFSSVKPASSLIKRVYMLILREIMELDLEARLMGETLVLNKSLDPFLEDYIELNDLNEPFELRRNQRDDLMPTIEEGEVIEEFRTRDDELDTEIDDYPSYCDSDKKIHIDCAHNLMFSCMIGFKFTRVNFFSLLYINVMYKKFHNSIMKNKMVYKGDNVVRALMNMPIFVGTFSVVTEFAVLEDMDAYRDKGMGDVIVGEPFLREVGIKTKRNDGVHCGKLCKRRAFWSLNEDILKITILKTNTPYPSRKIRHMAPLPQRKKIHPFLRVQVVDFQGMPELMRDGLFTRMRMEHHDDAGVVVFTSQAWRRLFGTRGPLVWELILEFLSSLRFGKAELVRLQICTQFDNTWAWVAMGPERQPDAAAGTPVVAEDAPAIDEGDQGLRRDVGSLHGLVKISMTDKGRFSTWMILCMAQLMDASGLTYQAFDGTF
ncbi:hypothetical protein Tco_0496387 [Tanacetum coccineum]